MTKFYDEVNYNYSKTMLSIARNNSKFIPSSASVYGLNKNSEEKKKTSLL